MFLLFLLALTWSQPCTTPQQILTSTILGSCSAGSSSNTYAYPLTVTSGSAFTVSGWFQLNTQGTDSQALFSLEQNGVRLGFVVHDQIIDFLYDSHTVSTAFAYSLKKWFMAAATLSYTLGYVNYYVWLPMNDLRIVQAPVSVGVNFNTAITSDAKLYLLYFGSYGLYCGRAQNVFFFDGYYESDSTYNWMNLAFLSNSVDTIVHFSLEDQSGQKVLGTSSNGYLGSTKGPDTADPTPGYYVKLSQTQYVTLPAVILNTNSQSISFWLWTNIAINGDAFIQSVDIGDEAIIFKRSYGNTQDQFQIMISGSSPYTLELNFGTTKAPILLTPTVTASTWTYVSIASTYTDSTIGVTKVYFSAYVNGVYHPHTQTSLAISYQESANDVIYLGNSLNQFTNEIRVAHLDIRSTYVNYYSATSVHCLTNCLHSINSYTQQICKKCITTYLQDDACAASCVAGSTGYQSAILPVCSRCPYQCSACSSGVLCTACSSGYYLSGTTCVAAASCGVGFLANPLTKQCTKCGDGTLQAGESCDDGNFIDGDGCTNCAVDTGYTCNSATPNVCSKQCGNGILDTGEQCDIGSSLINGCQNCILESGYECTGTSCNLLCGNGFRVNEDCDDGNTISGDGCSYCQVDFGYKCAGGTATSSDSCTKQCPNNVIDQTEQCDDNNNNSNDGCSYCRIEIGFKCVNNSCYSLCGNGEIDELEMCDDSNTIIGDGCSHCLIDYGYQCDDSGLSCHAVTVTCGDSYHSSSEDCEDGNTETGDGCSDVCAIETGYTCTQGLYKYSITPCTPICGDNIKIGDEQCDDGNLIDGDGCSRYCTIEAVCGNAIRETGEQCDDGNDVDMDGCTNCIPDPGYSCNLIVGGTVDKCNQCPNNCDECTSDGTQCTLCFDDYALYNYECYTQCPQSYYYDNTTCTQCPSNCLECFSTICTQCSMTTYLSKQQCLTECPDGYFQQLNGVLGNSCIKCYAPCVKCTSGLICLECDDTYRVENNECVACGFTTNCIKCNTDTCLECVVGYKPSGQECIAIESNCGDGLHALSEQCDDANLSGGCVDCKIQSGYNCILEQNEGPDVCYLLQPVTVSPYIDEIHFDTLYLYFDRPLSQIYNLTELLYVNVPDLEDYQYEAIQTDLQHISIHFVYYQTVQNIDAQLNFSVPNGIVDKFGWSLVGLATASSSAIAKFGLVKFTLNYYIFYNTDEIDFSDTLSYITLSFMCLCLISSMVYSLKVGSGQVWQILQSMQLISLLRLVKLRYSLHIDKVLRVLNYCNMSFIPNIFTWFITTPEQNTIKFYIEDYPSQFLLNAGGRFISFMIYALIFWLVVKVLIRFIHWEPVLNRLEDIDEYMHFQAFVRIFEVMFLDLMVSTVQTGLVYFTIFDIINIVIAAIYIIITIVFAVLLYRFVLKDPQAHKLEWLHLHFSCLYDGYDLKTRLGRLFIYVPYIRKIIYAFLFLLPSQFIQLISLAVLRIIMYPFLFRFNPFVMRILLYRQTVQALFDTLCFVSGLLYLNIDDTKEVKVTNGWYMLMTVLLSIINFTIWNGVLIFVRIRSPNYLLEENETEEEPQFKINQIVPMDYLPPEEEQKNGKVVPEGYEKPPEVGFAQIMPEQPLKGGLPDKSLQIIKDPDIISVKSEAPPVKSEAPLVKMEPVEDPIDTKQKEKELRKQATIQKKQQEALKKQEEEKDELVDDFFA